MKIITENRNNYCTSLANIKVDLCDSLPKPNATLFECLVNLVNFNASITKLLSTDHLSDPCLPFLTTRLIVTSRKISSCAFTVYHSRLTKVERLY